MTNPLVFNGVDAATGGYLFPPQTVAEVAAHARGEDATARQVRLLSHRHAATEDHLGLRFGVADPDDLAQTGWALVLHPDTPPAVVAALAPLCALRREQAGERYRELTVQPGESADDFLLRHGTTAADPADPRRVPYYLLLIGDPTRLPFAFQYELDVQYAVGRLDLDDPADVAAYARAVVAAEAAPRAGGVHLFGTRNPGDTATALSASRLVEPLATEIAELAPGVAVGCDLGDPATRARLATILADEHAAPVLFTATHGLGDTDPGRAGALVCQDWPGPPRLGRPPAPIAPGTCLAADDLRPDAPLGPRVVFAFACYSAGTPPTGTAPGATAALPRRMLANRERPVLGFVGHVDRAWGYSFLWTGIDPQITATSSVVLALAAGHRLGHALEYLNQRSAAIASDLVSRLDALRRFGKRIDDDRLAWLWTASNDARNYVVLGDPAVRACTA